jgi:hypothetical protein
VPRWKWRHSKEVLDRIDTLIGRRCWLCGAAGGFCRDVCRVESGRQWEFRVNIPSEYVVCDESNVASPEAVAAFERRQRAPAPAFRRPPVISVQTGPARMYVAAPGDPEWHDIGWTTNDLLGRSL